MTEEEKPIKHLHHTMTKTNGSRVQMMKGFFVLFSGVSRGVSLHIPLGTRLYFLSYAL